MIRMHRTPLALTLLVTAGSPTQSGNLAKAPLIPIGGVPETVQFAGLISPGPFQFNVVVPSSLSDGDQPITRVL